MQLRILLRASGQTHSKMLIGQPGRASSPGRPGQEARLQKIRLVHVLQGDGLLAYRRRQGLQAHRAASVVGDDIPKHLPVGGVQAEMIHFQRGQRLVRNGLCDYALLSSRFAIRGVPLARRAISAAPSASMGTPRIPALRVTIRQSSSGV